MAGKNLVYIATRLTSETGRHGRDFSLAVEKKDFGVYSTRRNAEKAVTACVRDFAAAVDWAPRLLGFSVKEVRVNRMLFEDDVWCPVYEREWTYAKDGSLFSYTPFSSDWREGAYEGTPPDAIKFAPGDYAWAYTCGKFAPVKVLAAPCTPDEWKKKFGFASDASDDCYLAVSVHGHLHPETCSLFPMDEEIPRRVASLIDDIEKKYINGESL